MKLESGGEAKSMKSLAVLGDVAKENMSKLKMT